MDSEVWNFILAFVTDKEEEYCGGKMEWSCLCCSCRVTLVGDIRMEFEKYSARYPRLKRFMDPGRGVNGKYQLGKKFSLRLSLSDFDAD
ncbi:hypothetical protein C5167_002160 [Papaver somniferum]|uniref:Uncharacterized protein n=1 Tax=Papaver somniferum TaxID=3469 RepID=A0A4Y7KYW8_PAPSO|nr:hypothetical protein C5167_002160 [Papaver somniferum]